MTIELNCKKYHVKRYKGEDVNTYFYKGTLYDEIPSHHDVLGIFTDADYGTVGVVDTTPKPVYIVASVFMLVISSTLLSISISTYINNGTSIVTQTYDVPKEVEVEDTENREPKIELYEYSYEFNRYARLYNKQLNLGFKSAINCHVSVYSNSVLVADADVAEDEEWDPDVDAEIADNIRLVVTFNNVSRQEIVLVGKTYEDIRRVAATVTNDEAVYKAVYPDDNSIDGYCYYSNGRYVQTDIVEIDSVRCIHIESNCDIQKSAWDADYHYPLVIGYTDTSDYNMILGTANKLVVPKTVKIIHNMFSLDTVSECSDNYFTYSEQRGIIDMYIPLGTLASDKLPLKSGAIIVPSKNKITVQINSNIVQEGSDTVNAVILK